MSLAIKDFVKMSLEDLKNKSDIHSKKYLEALTEEDIDLITERVLANQSVTDILLRESYSGIHNRVIEKINDSKIEDRKDMQSIRHIR